MHDKVEYVIHITNLKQDLNHRLVFENVHRAKTLANQKSWLKSFIDTNTNLRKAAKNDFGKDFFKLINDSVFCKSMENVRQHTNIKLVTTKKGVTILCLTETIILQSFSSKVCWL